MCDYVWVCMCALQILILACWLGSESRLSKDTERWAGGSLPAWRADVPPKDWIDLIIIFHYIYKCIKTQLSDTTDPPISEVYNQANFCLTDKHSYT